MKRVIALLFLVAASVPAAGFGPPNKDAPSFLAYERGWTAIDYGYHGNTDVPFTGDSASTTMDIWVKKAGEDASVMIMLNIQITNGKKPSEMIDDLYTQVLEKITAAGGDATAVTKNGNSLTIHPTDAGADPNDLEHKFDWKSSSTGPAIRVTKVTTNSNPQ